MTGGNGVPPLLYVFRRGWRQLEPAVRTRDAPAEAHGYFALRARGGLVEATDEDDTSIRWRVISELYQRLYAIPRSGLGYRLHQAQAVRVRLESDPERWVVATTDSLGLPLLSLKVRGRLSNPLAYLSIGLVDAAARGRVQRQLLERYRRLLEHADAILGFTPSEVERLSEWVDIPRVRLIPLGVDASWWRPPGGASPRPRTVLASGRDPRRSFRTLAAAVEGLPIHTTMVGSLALRQGVRSGPRLTVFPDIPITLLRGQMWRAAVVALPAEPSLHGSGQATALQAMAAGRPVVMTDTGWADASGLRAGEHFLGVPSADVAALRAAILMVFDDPTAAETMGAAAASFVRERLTPQIQGDAMLEALA